MRSPQHRFMVIVNCRRLRNVWVLDVQVLVVMVLIEVRNRSERNRGERDLKGLHVDCSYRLESLTEREHI